MISKSKKIVLYALIYLIVFITTVSCNDDDGFLSEYVYISQVVPLPYGVDYVEYLAYHDGKIYFTATTEEQKYLSSSYQAETTAELYSINPDGTELTRLPGYTPPLERPAGFDGALYIRGLSVDNEGCLWVVENWDFCEYDFPEEYDPETLSPNDLWQIRTNVMSGTVIRKIDSSGAELLCVDLSDLPVMGEVFNCTGFTVAGNIIYLANTDRNGDKHIYALDSNGKMLFSLSVQRGKHSSHQFIHMPDGSAAFPMARNSTPQPGSSGYSLQTIDADAGGLGEVFYIPELDYELLEGYSIAYPGGHRDFTGYNSIFPGNGDYDFFFNSGIELYGYNISDNKSALFLNWRENSIVNRMGINEPYELIVTPDNHVVYITGNYVMDRLTSSELVIMVKALRSELVEKTVLTLASIGVSNDMSRAVMEFNRRNRDCYIEIIDYNTDNDNYAGLMKLATDINTGNIPDIVSVEGLPYEDYVEAGLFADLYPFIDADPDLNRSDLVQSAFRPSEVDGGLYRLFPKFYVDTIVCTSSVAGTATGWNMEEFISKVENLSEAEAVGSFITKLVLLERELMFSIDEYVDIDTGTVSFDTLEFIQLLELIKKYPGVTELNDYFYSSDNMNANHLVINNVTITDFHSLIEQTIRLGSEAVVMGWPTANRNGHLINRGYDSLAIAESSDSKDDAWSFVRIFLDKDWQLNRRAPIFSGFPTNRAAYEQIATEAVGRSPNIIYDSVSVGTPTQEDVDTILALIDTASEASCQKTNLNGGLWDIISEGALDYFSGLKSAEETARVIQNRAAVYVSERN